MLGTGLGHRRNQPFALVAGDEVRRDPVGSRRTSSPSATREVERLLPDLSHLVVLNYFGEDEAWLELRSADATSQTG